jgi:hypothetical protein
VVKLLTRLSIQNLLHRTQTFILGQKNLVPKLAINLGIDLVFYGKNEAEYRNPITDNSSSFKRQILPYNGKTRRMYLAGMPAQEIIENYDLSFVDLMTFLPL